ncbi:MAG: glycosyltransferase [Clostridia bacterium]|nr:glycosyltransferase [Clostridia bacterium]
MLDKDKISIIVPVYNAEQYIEKCVQSILSQTYSNIEILLINDGSTDRSQEICEDFQNKDNRIRVINKKNGGPGSARNAGIINSTGKYIGFVDCDDFIDNDMYEILYNLCVKNDADISMINFRKIVDGNIKNNGISTEEIIIYNKIEAMKELLVDKKIKNYFWNKLFKKEIFTDLNFCEDCYFEDVELMIKVFEKINKLVHKQISKYNYVQRSDSLVNCGSYDKLKDFVKVTKRRYNYILNRNLKLDEYNAIGFVANMIIVYKNAVVYNISELFNDFENNYSFFSSLVEKYKSNIFIELSDYRRLLLCIILWDLELGKKIVKYLEE